MPLMQLTVEGDTIAELLKNLDLVKDEIRRYNVGMGERQYTPEPQHPVQQPQQPQQPQTHTQFQAGAVVGAGTQEQIDLYGELGKYPTPQDYLESISINGQTFRKSTLDNKPNSYGIKVPDTDDYINIEVFKGKWVMNRKIAPENKGEKAVYASYNPDKPNRLTFPKEYIEAFEDVLMILERPR